MRNGCFFRPAITEKWEQEKSVQRRQRSDHREAMDEAAMMALEFHGMFHAANSVFLFHGWELPYCAGGRRTARAEGSACKARV
jgi:hypothetical protein